MVSSGYFELVSGVYEPTKIAGGHLPTRCAPPSVVGRSYVDILNAYLERNLRSNGGVLDGVIFAMVKYTMEDLGAQLGLRAELFLTAMISSFTI